MSLAAAVLCWLAAPALSASGLPRVMILPIQNETKDPNYQFFQNSLDEAIAKSLRSQYKFRQLKMDQIKKLAKTNHMFEDDFGAPSVGMQLGLLAQQDVVIGGTFTSSGSSLETEIYLLDMANHKIHSRFKMEGYTDGRIWDTVNAISQKISKEAEDILPNEEEWERSSLLLRSYSSRAVLAVGLTPAWFSEAGLGKSATLGPDHSGQAFLLSLQYERDNFTQWSGLGTFLAGRAWRNIFLRAAVDLEIAGNQPGSSGDFSADADVSLWAVQPTAGLGYNFSIGRRISVAPVLSTGLYVGRAEYTFTTSDGELVDSEGKSRNSQTQQYVTSLYDLSLIGRYAVTPDIFAGLQTRFRAIAFDDSWRMNTAVSLSIGLAF